MTLAAVQGGAQAAGRPLAGLAVGQQADGVVLDAQHPALAGLDAPSMLSVARVRQPPHARDRRRVGRRPAPGRTPAATRYTTARRAGFVAARRQLLEEHP